MFLLFIYSFSSNFENVFDQLFHTFMSFLISSVFNLFYWIFFNEQSTIINILFAFLQLEWTVFNQFRSKFSWIFAFVYDICNYNDSKIDNLVFSLLCFFIEILKMFSIHSFKRLWRFESFLISNFYQVFLICLISIEQLSMRSLDHCH